MLPIAWIDKMFARLQGIYGREFTSQFSVIDANGNDVGMANAKQVWAEELAGFVDKPEAIAFVLKNLPDRVPNAIKFRDMCRQAPVKTLDLQLGYQKVEIDNITAKENLEKIRQMISSSNIFNKIC
jgi:hypothetical protein